MIRKTLFLLLLFPLWAFTQTADFRFYTTADGLSGSFTHGITQDERGFLWILNDYKLHRFDGRNFVVYAPPADTSGKKDELVALYRLQGSLLLLLSPSHLYLFEPNGGVWQSFPAPKLEGRKTVLKDAYPLENGDYGLILYSEDEQVLDVYTFNGQQFGKRLHKNIPFPPGRYYTLLPDGQLLLYQRTIERYLPDGAKEPDTLRSSSAGGGGFLHIDWAENGDLVFLKSTPEAYLIFNLNLETEMAVPHPVTRHLRHYDPYLTAARPLSDGSLWLCGPDRTLAYYDAAADTLIDFSAALKKRLPNVNDVLYPFIDNTGTVWVMTRLGLLRVSLPEQAFDQYLSEPLGACDGFCSFRGMAESPDGDLFAAYYHGIARINPGRQKVATLFSPDDYRLPLPSDLHADEHGLWLNNGHLMDPETGAVLVISGAKNVLHEEGLFAKGKEGPLWWVFEHELFYLDSSNGQLRWEKALELPQKGEYVTEAIQVGRWSGAVFISHNGQLLHYRPDTQQQKWYSPGNKGFSVNHIFAIEETAPGQLWLATDVGLLSLQLESGAIKRFTTEDGLSNNYVCGMLSEGDSALWLSTNHGLSRFGIADQSFMSFFEEDGLSHNEFNRKSYFKAKDGRMYFGGLQGITAFYPEELLHNQQQRNEMAEVVLNAFEYVDEQKDTTIRRYNFGQEPTIHLRYWHRSFTFEYALTDYRNPEEITYSYRMKGYEENWSAPSKFSFTRFSSLPAGQYTFEVKARDSNGHWHPNQLTVQVVVHAPWWASWWAYFSYVLLLAAVLYYFWRNALRQQALQNNLKLEKIEADKLKELDSFKSRLYTNLTHEFRTPLTVILGMAEQIKNAPQKHLDSGIELIRNNGKNLLQLINQLLDLSKLESGGLKLKLQQGDIVPYLRYLAESFQTYANSQNLSLRFHTNLESFVMDYDPEQLKQIMTNLISNAVKFTPSGGEVTVRAKAKDKQLLLEVSDTGVGIDKDKLPYIFNRFYQADSSTTRRGEGTGIGLAHTQELVKLMGGRMAVESELGKGTKFTVMLPVNNQADVVKGSVSSATEEYPLEQALAVHLAPSNDTVPDKSVSTTAEHPHLLIVEDNPDVVTYLKSCLSGFYQLDVAYNGRIGIEKAIQNIPDLIISDVMMPEKNGYEVCDTLKNDERTSHIPIILLTAKADASSKIAGLRRGADAYLAKPFDREELLVRLAKLVERQQRMVAYFSTKLPIPEVKKADIQVEDEFIQKVQHVIEQHYKDENFSLPQLCQKIRMSRSQLYRKMKALTGTSPSSFIRSYRLNKAKELLESTEMNVSEVAWEVGFKDVAHFSKSYQDNFGFSPSATKM
jgi:signal transduction histidine kinase/DNA-binding response OmpR family regulator